MTSGSIESKEFLLILGFLFCCSITFFHELKLIKICNFKLKASKASRQRNFTLFFLVYKIKLKKKRLFYSSELILRWIQF